MTTPTTLRELLSHDIYRDYFKRPPKPYNSSSAQWAVVAVSHTGKFGKVYRPTFKEAFLKGKELLAREEIRDISIFCRNRISPMPEWAPRLMSFEEDWCGRCRRPSVFRIYHDKHPALRDAPVIVEDVRRCYFCGISWDYISQHERR